MQPEAFPEKPATHDYGYVHRGRYLGCTQGALIETCRTTTVALAWAPEADRIVAAVELPFLLPAIRARTRSLIRANIGFAIACAVIYGLPLVSGKNSEGRWLMILTFAIFPLVQGLWRLWELRNETPEKVASQIPSARYGAWVPRQRKRVTWTLLGIIISVFLVQSASGLAHSVHVAGLTKTEFSFADIHRFLTATLMHAGVFHILMNASALFLVGMTVESLLGGAGLAFIFLIAALGGSTLSYLLSTHTSVGASGGIMGLIGCLAILGFRYRAILPPKFGRQVLISVLIVALTGIVAHNIIDNSAHAGGLVTGALLGWFLTPARKELPIQLSSSLRWCGWLSLVVTIGGAVLIAFLIVRK